MGSLYRDGWVRTVKTWQILDLLEKFKNRCNEEYLKIFMQAMIEAFIKKHPVVASEQAQARV